jgi:hypothetical protein
LCWKGCHDCGRIVIFQCRCHGATTRWIGSLGTLTTPLLFLLRHIHRYVIDILSLGGPLELGIDVLPHLDPKLQPFKQQRLIRDFRENNNMAYLIRIEFFDKAKVIKRFGIDDSYFSSQERFNLTDFWWSYEKLLFLRLMEKDDNHICVHDGIY